jgi:hypothetical protein
MNKKLFYCLFGLWFILVNLPQFFSSLNRVEPVVFGLPFNMAWIWGLNLVMTGLMIYFYYSRNTRIIGFERFKKAAKEKGLEVQNK